MHKILRNTHKESNINILKARDYYFDKARFINNRLCKACLLGPIVVSVIGMFAVGILKTFSQEGLAVWLEENIDFIVGCIAIAAFVLDFLFKNRVGDFLSKSNALREMYDVKVLGIEPNDFYYHYTEKEIEEFLETAKYVKDSDKYEVWYREIFSDSDFSNAICAMMDNIIYTYYVYNENKKQHFYKLICVMVLVIAYCIAYALGWVIVNPFVLFLAIFDYVKDTVDAYFVSKDLALRNEELKKIVIEKSGELLNSEKDKKLILRCIQDVVIDNREKGLFISKSVRNKFLNNDNIYYKELDKIKNIFWGKEVTMPHKAKDFQIATIEDENICVDFAMIHQELTTVLEDIKTCLERHKISFMLDGGTLIGSCRRSNNNAFLEWDDDIDISVKSADVDKMIQVLQEELSDRYVIQDCKSEKYYSPRLSRLRIRQKHDKSIVAEKDSVLYELYENRGLFIDVYAYSPILLNRAFDAAFRRVFIHPINRKILKTELDWKYGNNPENALEKFTRLKRKYLNRVEWYKKHAKNTKVVAYEPSYVYNLKKAGPYIAAEDIYGKATTGIFEGKEYEIPSDSGAVLSAFYGEDWEKSPYIPLEELIATESIPYSKATFDSSKYKHLKRVSIY